MTPMTSITASPTRLQGRSPAWRLGAATTAAIGDRADRVGAVGRFRQGLDGGFFGDAATYYTLGHSLAHDFDFEYRRDDLVRVWKEFPSGPEGIFLKRGSDGRICSTRRRSSIRCLRRRSSGCSAPTASWCCTRC